MRHKYFLTGFVVMVPIILLFVSVFAAYSHSPSQEIIGQELGYRLQDVTPAPTISSDPTLGALESRIAALEKKIEAAPTDDWDRISAILAPLAAILIAFIGGLISHTYNKSQTQIARVQAVQNAVQDLLSDDTRRVTAALLPLATIDKFQAENIARVILKRPDVVEMLSEILNSQKK